jgi:hypothetical protein
VGIKLQAIPLSVGCENLKGFHKFDPYFRSVVIALDADSSLSGSGKYTKNIIKLPGGAATSGAGLSPERTIYKFIRELIDSPAKHPVSVAALKAMTLNSDYLAELLEGDYVMSNRESAKSWMRKNQEKIEQWKLIELWIDENDGAVQKFEEALIGACRAAVAHS